MHNASRSRLWFLVIVLALTTLLVAGCARPGASEPLPTEDPNAVAVGGGEDVDPLQQTLEAAFHLTETAAAVVAAPTEVPPVEGDGGAVIVDEGGGDGGGDGGGELVSEATATPIPLGVTPTPQPLQPIDDGAGGETGGGTTGLPTTHTVQPGEWVYQIGRTYGVTAAEIIAANPGINPDFIEPGQVLNIPAPGTTSGSGSDTTGRTHVVQVGENLFRISLGYGKSYVEVANANGIASPYTVYPGQVLVIP